jgi:ribosomal protein L31E
MTITIEREYTVPLRAGYRNAPAYYRTNKAVSTLRKFLMRHMKAKDENIRMGQHLNLHLWKHGIKNPPARVTIHVTKDDAGIVRAELVGKSYSDTVKPMPKTEQAGSMKEKLESLVKGKDKTEGSDAEEKTDAKEAKAEKPKKEAKPKAKPQQHQKE